MIQVHRCARPIPPYRHIALLLTSAALCLAAGAGCVQANPEYCESQSDCDPKEFCDAVELTCRARSAAAQPDAGVDASTEPACSNDSHHCVADAIPGWLGPVLRVDASADSELETCPVPYEQSVAELGDDVVATGTCACACGEATAVSCSAATVQARSSTDTGVGQCMLECFGGCPEVDVDPMSCVPVSQAFRESNTLRFVPGHVADGSCGAPMVQSSLQPAQFAVRTRLCASTEFAGGCGDDETCAPRLDESDSAGLCLYRDGEHQCPAAGPYQHRTVRYRNIVDDRQCADDCQCDLPSESCQGSLVSLRDNCDQTLASTPGCISSTPSGLRQLSYHPALTGHMCEASGGHRASANALAGVSVDKSRPSNLSDGLGNPSYFHFVRSYSFVQDSFSTFQSSPNKQYVSDQIFHAALVRIIIDHIQQVEPLLQSWLIAIGIFEKLLGKIVGDLAMIREQKLLETEDIIEGLIVDFSRRIDITAQVVETINAIGKGGIVWFLDPVLGSPLSGGIEILQSESIGINPLVAGIAGFAFLVLIDLLPQGGGIPSVFGFDDFDIFRWWGKRCAYYIFRNPGTAQNRRSIVTISRHLEHASHCQESPRGTSGRKTKLCANAARRSPRCHNVGPVADSGSCSQNQSTR